jgi:hypothetical protein
LAESREDLVGKALLTWSRRLEPFELGMDLGDLFPTKGDATLDLVVDDVAALDEIDKAPEFFLVSNRVCSSRLIRVVAADGRTGRTANCLHELLEKSGFATRR